MVGDAPYGRSRENFLLRQFRILCVSFCAAAVVVVSLHGASDTRHELAHASDWPPVASPLSGLDADHDPLHVHVAPSDADPDHDVASNGTEDETGPRIDAHHHASHGDHPNAAPPAGQVMLAVLRSAERMKRPSRDHSRPGHDGEGLDDPPKQTRTVI
jgi:hypothetical protein